ncbi:MAG TPA: Smr/MutS family protein [Haliangiales bacterium]|nr:Smr/MutS family protein [Haliangiales bacterium]
MDDKTLHDLQWDRILAELAARCHTGRGAEAALALAFLVDPEAARRRLAEIAEARLLRQLEEPLPFGQIHDVRAALDHVERGGDLEGPDLVAVGETVLGCARLRRHVRGHAAEAPLLAARVDAIAELPHVSGPILDSFEEGGRLADHASPELGPMRRRVASLHEELARRVKELLDDDAIAPFLQDRFWTQRDERYVVPLRADARARVKGIVHGTSQSGHTVFVEPEAVVDLNNRLKMAESDVADEERRILAALTAYVREESSAIRAGADAVESIDVLDGAALLADALDAAAPEIGGAELLLRRARHAGMVLSGRACVPNDIELGAGRSMIISGPNAGGKTVALKTTGLAALLVRAGLCVPAEAGSRIPWYERVETDIGDDQSIEKNLSTFSAHVHRLREIMASAGAATLVLIDEVAAGTDPEQGSALAQAFLETLAERGGHALVTTHYERLKALPTRDARFVNASVGFDLTSLSPTFRLHLGVPGSSGALWVARRLGMASDVVSRAEALLGDRRAGIEELLTAVAEERRRLEVERAAADAARREADRAARAAEGAERAARAREERAKKTAFDESMVALRQARDELDELRRRLRQGDKDAAAAAKARVGEIAGAVAAHAPATSSAGGRRVRPEDLRAGTPVVVAHLGGRGVVVGPPERGRVTVQVGKIRTTCAVEDLRADDAAPPNRAERRADVAVRRRAAAAPAEPNVAADDLAPARTVDATVDVRGERVDDALALIDKFIDESLLASRDVAFVIHGHGTGALRNAVREHLAMHAAVSKWRAGKENEGGDGITVLWLDV